MKRIVIAGLLPFVAMGSVLAADLPQPYTPPPPPRAPAVYVPSVVPVYNWGGFYIGLNGGYAFGDSDWTTTGATTGNFNLSGGLVGGTVGANYQMGQFVIGVETDIDWADVKGSASTACVGCQTANNWLGTIRGRAGYAWDRVLVFATAGGAYGNVKASLPAALGSGSENSTEFGWTAGAGLEVAVAENITIKAEYLFVDLANGNCSGVACGSPSNPIAVKFDESLIRAGLNFKFGGF